jgi:hypothetical protein
VNGTPLLTSSRLFARNDPEDLGSAEILSALFLHSKDPNRVLRPRLLGPFNHALTAQRPPATCSVCPET